MTLPYSGLLPQQSTVQGIYEQLPIDRSLEIEAATL
jgi:hypothetical protein